MIKQKTFDFKVSELEGVESLKVLFVLVNLSHTIAKISPNLLEEKDYENIDVNNFKEILHVFDNASVDKKKLIITHALAVYSIDVEEIEVCLKYCYTTDADGISTSLGNKNRINLVKKNPEQILNCIIAVLMKLLEDTKTTLFF